MHFEKYVHFTHYYRSNDMEYKSEYCYTQVRVDDRTRLGAEITPPDDGVGEWSIQCTNLLRSDVGTHYLVVVWHRMVPVDEPTEHRSSVEADLDTVEEWVDYCMAPSVVCRGRNSDVWVAHALLIDVISQGDTTEQAMEALREAVTMVVKDDLGEGRQPTDRDRAPLELWPGKA